MKDKPTPDNHDLLPRELSQARKPENISRFDAGTSSESEAGRFSIINATTRHTAAATQTLGMKAAADAKAKSGANAKTEDSKNASISKAGGKSSSSSSFTKQSTAQMAFKTKKDTAKADGTAQKGMTADNYRKEYLRKKKEREDIALGKKLTPKEKLELILKERKKLEEETFLRVKARELMNLIIMWRQEFGMGNHEASYIAGQIVELERQLNLIDPRYWP